MNRNVLDNPRVNAAGSFASSFMDFDALNLTLEQQLFDGKGGIEFAYDEQEYFNKRNSAYGDWFGLNVDINEYLPNDQPNPNVGRIHGHAETEQRENKWNRESQRTTAFYELDFTENEGWMSNLGSHLFTGLWNEQTIDYVNLDRRGRWDDGITNPASRTARDIMGGGLISRSGSRATLLKIYVSDDIRGLSSFDDVRIQAPKGRHPAADEEFFIMWNDRDGADPDNPFEPQGPLVNPAGGADPATYDPRSGLDPMFYNSFIHRDLIVQVGSLTKQVIDSQALAWQGRWLDGHVVSLVGWREDESVTRAKKGFGRDDKGFPLPEQFQFGDPDPKIKGNTGTRSLVAHIPEEWIGDWMGVSLHYNESDSFQPTSTARNVRGEIIPPPTATTEEVGVTFEFLEGALSLRISKYDMVVSDYDPAGGLDRLVSEFGEGLSEKNWAQQWIKGNDFDTIIAHSDNIPGGSSGNFTSYAQIIDAFANADPFRSLNNRRYEPALPDPAAVLTVDRINGKTATREFVSEGTEIELIGNITPNWRIALSGGEQETITSNTAPVALAAAREYQQNLMSAGLWNLQAQPSLINPDEPLTVGLDFENQILASLLNAVARDGTVSGEQVKWRWNVISAYDFLEGPLKGVGVGGVYRWQDEVSIGYAKTLHPATGAIIDDISKPFFGESEYWFDLFAYYSRPFFFWSDKVRWKIQLNIRNAYGTDDYIPVRRNPDGEISVVRNPPPKDIFLTNTFSF